jgi:hypothetical protein
LGKVSEVVIVSSHGFFVGRKFMYPHSGIKRAMFSYVVPAKAGPIAADVAIERMLWPQCDKEMTVVMGPRLRGDDSWRNLR